VHTIIILDLVFSDKTVFYIVSVVKTIFATSPTLVPLKAAVDPVKTVGSLIFGVVKNDN